MRRNHTWLRGLAVTVAAVGLLGHHLSGQEQVPAFRTRVDVVRVDVLVTDKARPVAGLREADFEVFDNGVRQQARLITDRGDLTLVLVLDTSASVRGRRLDDLLEATRSVLDDVKPGDRVALLTFSERLTLQSAPTTDIAAVRARLGQLSGAGSTALNDAVFAGAWLAGPEAQRRVVLAFSDGRDTMSWLTPEFVEQSVVQSDALVYGVTVGTRRRQSAASGPPPDTWRDDPIMDPALKRAYERALDPGRPPKSRAEIAMDEARRSPEIAMDEARRSPVPARARDFLTRAAEASGGQVFDVEKSGDLKSAFRRVLDEVRARYVLAFTPSGVRRDDGLHRLEVKLAGTRKGQVTARQSYYAR